MQYETLLETIAEAERFIERAKTLAKLQKASEGSRWTPHFPKEQGLVKRASMDLTRVLADLRQGR